MNEVTVTTPACLVRLRTTPEEVRAIAERLGMFTPPPAPPPVFVVGKRKLFKARPIVLDAQQISLASQPALSDCATNENPST